MRKSSVPGPVDRRRRDFLIRCWQGASAALIPAGLRGTGLPFYDFASDSLSSSNSEFHFHPHYRMSSALDAVLLKAQAGLDDFVTEKYADQIAAILAQWSSGLLQSPQDVSAIEKVLVPTFSGSSPLPAESRVVRSGPTIEVRHNQFNFEATVGREEFLRNLRSVMGGFSKLQTAEFQVTSVDAGSMPSVGLSPGKLSTRIRYELVGTGAGFYRGQRVGSWQLAWERSASD